MVRHFFPWWWEPDYVTDAVTEASLTAEERLLISRHGLSLEQIGHRRILRDRFGIQAGQSTRKMRTPAS